MLVNILDDSTLKKNKETFQAIDSDYSGLISLEELKQAFIALDIENLPDDQVEQIVKKVDYDKNGEINYSEFLSGTIDLVHLSEENLLQLFKHLDVNNENFVTKEGLLKVFQRSSKDIGEEEIEEMLREASINPDEKINYQTFLSLMKTIVDKS